MGFSDWLLFGLPVTIIMIPVIFFVLLLFFRPEKNFIKKINACIELKYKEKLEHELNWKQVYIMLTFTLTVLLWFTEKIPDFISSWLGWSGHGISSGIIALIPAILLPLAGILDGEDLRDINWEAILIIGGGLSLGTLIVGTGISDWFAYQLLYLQELPKWVIIFSIAVVAILLTMIASNTASAAIMIPVVIPLGIFLGIDPVLLTVITAIGCSIDFALPMGTPPSTLAYSTGKIKFKEMVRVGVLLDILGTLVLTTITLGIWILLGLVYF